VGATDLEAHPERVDGPLDQHPFRLIARDDDRV